MEEEPAYGKAHLNEIIRDKNPQTRVLESDASTFEALEKFCQEVKIIAHTVNNKEKWAVLELFKAPELHPNEPITERPVDLREPNCIVLGMFGGYKSALVQTEQGDQSRDELYIVLKHFPNAKFILALGVAYSYPEKAKYGDVLVSKFIDGVGNIKYTNEGMKIFRACSCRLTEVLPGLRNVFARGEETWGALVDFKCVKNEGRTSRVHSGLIISERALVDNRDERDKSKTNAPEAIGGEMEGVVLVEIQKTSERGIHASPRELGVIVMKGVSDYADGSMEKKWQLTAAMAAASYAEHKLKLTDGKLFIGESK